jgi:putative ABC transport system substrate-binding protein
LRDLGYVEGQNLKLEWRFAEGDPSRLPKLAAELVSLKLDAIVLNDTPAAQAAKRATDRVPLIMGITSQPEETGLVQSLAHPGGNITGLTSSSSETAGKRLELLKQIAPSVSRVGVFWVPGNPVRDLEWAEVQRAAAVLGVDVMPFLTPQAEDLSRAFAASREARVDGLLFAGEPLYFMNRTSLIDLTNELGLPAVHESDRIVADGALISYGVSLPDLLRRSASYVDQVLKGANPADLPVERPTRFNLVVNLDVACQQGVVIPSTVLLRADQLLGQCRPSVVDSAAPLLP